MRDLLNDTQLDRLVRQKPQAPVFPSFRGLRARQRDQAGLGAPIEGALIHPIWHRTFERRIQALPTKTLPHALYRSRGGLQHLRGLFVDERLSVATSVLTDIGLEQDASTVEHPLRERYPPR